MMKH